jgi:hypothetical protein
MGVNVSAHYVTQFTTNVQLLLQQKGSKLRDFVTTQTHYGDKAVAVEQIGAISAKIRSGRGAPIILTDSPETRRWVFPVDYLTDAEIIDRDDKIRMLIDPQGSYATNAVYALGRQMDDTILAALYATALTGQTAATSVTFPSSQQVGVNVGGTGSSLNMAKLRNALQILIANEVDVMAEEPTVVVNAKQHDALLNEVQVIDKDFNRGESVIENGRVTRILGMRIVISNRIPLNGSAQALVPVFVKSGVHLGMWNDVQTFINEQPTLEKNPTTVYAAGTFGATRIEEGKVVQITAA